MMMIGKMRSYRVRNEDVRNTDVPGSIT